jgi:hypothetical protein
MHLGMYLYYHPRWLYRIVGSYSFGLLLLLLNIPIPTPVPLIEIEEELAHTILKLHKTYPNENRQNQQLEDLSSF